MGTEEVYDLLHVFVFLRAQEAVIEDPVVGFAVFVLGAKECNSRIYQFEHLVAAFDTLGMLLDAVFFEVHAGR